MNKSICFLPDEQLALLDEEVWDTIFSNFSTSYSSNLRSHAKAYNRFCQLFRLAPFPASEWQLCRFGQYYSKFVYSANTVKNMLDSVKSLQLLAGHEPIQLTRRYNSFNKGLKSNMVCPIRQAKAMTPAILKQIRQIINENDPLKLVVFTMCLVGFFLFLRASNLVPAKGRRHFNPAKQFTRQDIRIQSYSVSGTHFTGSITPSSWHRHLSCNLDT